ncbi:MAG: ABC transporter ATP-binding protein [Actinobacteria bacterium]|nr:ABC transporter ATP-binding protein [Actinomycetota bacterium]
MLQLEKAPVRADNKSKKARGSEAAIKVEGVWEKFRLYHDKGSTLKETLVRLRRGRSYEDFWALKDVSFEVNKGEVFGIIGENGSGKSTLLKCISRILAPTKGSIRVNGRVSALLEVGAGFHPELTGRENVYLNGTILGLSRKEITKRFDEIVHFAELEQFIDMPVRNYSSGMYVRLGFAIAVNVDPDVLLVDEVLAVGDASFQDKCKAKIDEIRSGGKTILFVSHSFDDIRRVCDRVACLEKGEVVAVGSTERAVDLYLDKVRQKQEEELREKNIGKDQSISSPKGVVYEGNNRWGSMEAEVIRVRLLSSRGEERYVYESGEPLVISIDYDAHERIEKPTFGVVFHRSDGIITCGMNTKHGRFRIDFIQGKGTVEYRIPDLLLLEGSYDLSVAIYDDAAVHPYDHHEKLYHLKVIPGAYTIKVGIFQLPASWNHQKSE